MNRRHLALPRVWMLTDERQGEVMWNAIASLPSGTGVIVRHYSLRPAQREAFARLLIGRGLTVAFGGPERMARKVGAQLVYGADPRRGMLPRIYPVHNRTEIVAAERARAALLLLSPAFSTRSHPDVRALAPVRFGLLAQMARTPVIALGGMTPNRFRHLSALGAHGWAAIDEWIAAAARDP